MITTRGRNAPAAGKYFQCILEKRSLLLGVTHEVTLPKRRCQRPSLPGLRRYHTPASAVCVDGPENGYVFGIDVLSTPGCRDDYGEATITLIGYTPGFLTAPSDGNLWLCVLDVDHVTLGICIWRELPREVLFNLAGRLADACTSPREAN